MTRGGVVVVAGAVALMSYAGWLAWQLDAHEALGAHIFGSFWASGDAANRGLNPFGAYGLTPVQDFGTFIVPENNLNPPILLAFFQLAALADPYVAARTWLIASALLFVGTLAALARQDTARLPLLWAFSNWMVLETLLMGQIYVLLFALAAAAWLALRRGRLPAAGMALGVLVAIKPNFGLALLILALAGHRRVAGWGAAAALLLSVLPLALYGPETYELWLAAVRADLHWVYWADASLIGFSSRVDERPLGVLIAAVVAVACVAIARRPRATVADAAYLGLAASVLCSPLAWFHYLLVLVPALLDRRWRLAEWAVAAALMPPLQVLVDLVPAGVGSAWLKGYYVAIAWTLVALRIGPLLAPGSARARDLPTDDGARSVPHPPAVVPERRQVDAGGAALS